MNLIDSHCHLQVSFYPQCIALLNRVNIYVFIMRTFYLQDERISEDTLESVITASRSSGLEKLVVNGCWPGDWQRVLSLASTYPETILPQLGLHPWWVSRRNEVELLDQPDGGGGGGDDNNNNWLAILRRLLIGNPIVGLGECGLDKGSKALARASWEEQLEAFKLQLQLAQELQRPLSVHCVLCFGAMYELINQASLTVPVVLHAWTGTAEMTELFLKLSNVHFSLSGHLTRVAPTKALPMLRLLGEKALHRCLIESDAPDGALRLSDAWIEAVPALKLLRNDLETDLGTKGKQGGGEINSPLATLHMLKLVATVLDKPETEIAQATYTNAQRVFCFSSS
jgi:TatD DNase family protein